MHPNALQTDYLAKRALNQLPSTTIEAKQLDDVVIRVCGDSFAHLADRVKWEARARVRTTLSHDDPNNRDSVESMYVKPTTRFENYVDATIVSAVLAGGLVPVIWSMFA